MHETPYFYAKFFTSAMASNELPMCDFTLIQGRSVKKSLTCLSVRDASDQASTRISLREMQVSAFSAFLCTRHLRLCQSKYVCQWFCCMFPAFCPLRLTMKTVSGKTSHMGHYLRNYMQMQVCCKVVCYIFHNMKNSAIFFDAGM